MKLEIWVAVDEKDKLIKWHKYPDLLVDGLIGNGIERVKYICRAEIDGTPSWGRPPNELSF